MILNGGAAIKAADGEQKIHLKLINLKDLELVKQTNLLSETKVILKMSNKQEVFLDGTDCNKEEKKVEPKGGAKSLGLNEDLNAEEKRFILYKRILRHLQPISGPDVALKASCFRALFECAHELEIGSLDLSITKPSKRNF